MDFANISIGTVVKRSKHYIEESCGRNKGQLGIVADKEFFEERGKIVCYPSIHWEGEQMASITHPQNAELFR